MSKMFAEERRKQILEILFEKKRVTIQELANAIEVSDATLRNDLTTLEKMNLLKRTHGGAILEEEVEKEYHFSIRQLKNKDEKYKIAKKALELVTDNQCIMLDASSTALELARLLANMKKRLTIVTNGINTAMELNNNPDLTVILIGGIIQKSSMALEGNLGVGILEKINIDSFFVSANGFTTANGLQDFSVYEVELKKQMIKHASKVIALLDHSKMNKNSIATFASVQDIDVIITNKELERNQTQELNLYNKKLTILYPDN
ncbi:DeoR/GlpR family DNA-binding transcription regulator [Lysinibacillus telephonicus]|uniref:DeoR/GlpR transcriptional regulator n=2 Tax=Lysinibacillus telephonicus TaxID=1714840 RepID=A0A431UR46_9BACI|nr:DeoR/GlpR family DNA-binding transcription regulator [Lysinibacillus telephonicus]RTQ92655.1 DeoR/GlpR transcriptional regulator [Lysinibacillus telephonicus]